MKSVAALGIALAVVSLAAGCGDVTVMAQRYRAEKALYSARKVEQQARLAGRPDSTKLLALRQTYVAVRSSVPLPANRPSSGPSSIQYRDLYRVLATAELQGARLAMEARRPDLALASVEWISTKAGSDTTAARQADLLMISAYRGAGRYDDAVAKIHEMLSKYPPRQVPGGEDAILLLPEAAIEIRGQLGDEAGFQKEQRAAVDYYRKLLTEPHPGELTARIRARYVRALLGVEDSKAALAEAQRLEDDVRGDSALADLVPDVMFVNAKVHVVTDPDPTVAVGLLQKVAEQYPKSSVAGPALLEAATLLEAQKKFLAAKQLYKRAAAEYPENIDVAPASLFRLAVLEEAGGNWEAAKALLESIPINYPGSKASAEAPISIVQHYSRAKDQAATQTALQKAVDTYNLILKKGVSPAAAATYRWDILQCEIGLKNWEAVFTTVDDIVAHHPGQPFTAQALLVGAKAARAQNLKDRAASYLERFLQDYPDSPAAGKVRAELQQLGGG